MEPSEAASETLLENVEGNSEETTPSMMTDDTTMEEGPTAVSFLQLKFLESKPPRMVLRTGEAEFGMMGSNGKKTPVYTKGVKFSPDGLCLLSNSNDNIIRLFEL